MDTPIIIYGYTPSFALTVFAAVWFAAAFVVHCTATIRYRSWWFIPFTVGLGLEVVGYIGRCLSSKSDPYNLIYYIINYFFIVTAPVVMSASIYTILSTLIHRFGKEYAVLPPRVILWFFISSDVVATIVQVAGAALVGRKSAAREDPAVANNILLGGLAYQVFCMTAFIGIAGIFIVRAGRVIKSDGLLVFVIVCVMATLLIFLRTVFRLAETGQGLFGSLQTHEVYFACLEFAPVALTALLLAVWHPGRCLGWKRQTSTDKSVALASV